MLLEILGLFFYLYVFKRYLNGEEALPKLDELKEKFGLNG